MHVIETAVPDPSRVHADLLVVGDGYVTKGGCFIYVPYGFVSKNLLVISSTIEVVGVFLITTDKKKYATSQITTFVQITPSRYVEVDVDGVPYYEFQFDPGTVVFPNRFVQVVSGPVYNLSSYIYDFGNRPFWMDAVLDAELLSETKKWNGFTVFSDQIVADVYAAHTQRKPGDLMTYFRQTLKKDSDLRNRVAFIPLREGTLNKTSRLAKIADVELKRGIRSALTVEPARAEFLEDLYMR